MASPLNRPPPSPLRGCCINATRSVCGRGGRGRFLYNKCARRKHDNPSSALLCSNKAQAFPFLKHFRKFFSTYRPLCTCVALVSIFNCNLRVAPRSSFHPSFWFFLLDSEMQFSRTISWPICKTPSTNTRLYSVTASVFLNYTISKTYYLIITSRHLPKARRGHWLQSNFPLVCVKKNPKFQAISLRNFTSSYWARKVLFSCPISDLEFTWMCPFLSSLQSKKEFLLENGLCASSKSLKN